MIPSVVPVVGRAFGRSRDWALAPTGITETQADGYDEKHHQPIICRGLIDMDSDEQCERLRLLRNKAEETIAWSRENVRWAKVARERAKRYRAEARDWGVDIDATWAGCQSDDHDSGRAKRGGVGREALG
jgi:hypothetical protein